MWLPEALPQVGYKPLSIQFQYRTLWFPFPCVSLRSTGLRNIYKNANPKHGDVILDRDSKHQFLLRRDKALVPQCDKCLNVIGNYAEVWCVPSATHVSCIHRSQNEFLWNAESDTYFFFLTHWILGSRKYWKMPMSSHINIYSCFGSLPHPIFQRQLIDRSSVHSHFGP